MYALTKFNPEVTMKVNISKFLIKDLKKYDEEYIQMIFEQARYNTFTSNVKINYKFVLCIILLLLIVVCTMCTINLFFLNLPLKSFLSPTTLAINFIVFYYVFNFLKDIIYVYIMKKAILELINN